MKTWFFAVSMAGVFLLTGPFAFAQGPGWGPGPGGPGWGERPCRSPWSPEKGLQLTPEQKSKLDELRKNFRLDNAQTIGAIVAKRIELQSLWSDPKADEKVIQEKAKELRGLKNQLWEKSLQMRLETRKFLTPDQVEKMGNRREWRPGRGPGRGWSRDCGACY
jgi:Spy/CpxP family protein refolding chaperone